MRQAAQLYGLWFVFNGGPSCEFLGSTRAVSVAQAVNQFLHRNGRCSGVAGTIRARPRVNQVSSREPDPEPRKPRTGCCQGVLFPLADPLAWAKV